MNKTYEQILKDLRNTIRRNTAIARIYENENLEGNTEENKYMNYIKKITLQEILIDINLYLEEAGIESNQIKGKIVDSDNLFSFLMTDNRIPIAVETRLIENNE